MTQAATGSGEFWLLPGPGSTSASPRGLLSTHPCSLKSGAEKRREAPEVGRRHERRVPYSYHLRKKMGGGTFS